MFGVVFANVAHARHFMQAETSCRALYTYFLRDRFGADLGVEGGGSIAALLLCQQVCRFPFAYYSAIDFEGGMANR